MIELEYVRRNFRVFKDQKILKEIAPKSLLILSFALYIFSIMTTHVSVLDEANFLALIIEYPITYWASIVLMLSAICISKGKIIYVELSLLFIYLVNTPFLVESNIRIQSAYWPLGLGEQVSKDGTLVNTISKGPYVYFPGYVFLASMGSQVIGLPVDVLLKIFSIILDLTLLWNVFMLNRFILASWQVPERLRSQLLVVSSLLFIAGSWINVMYFHPMSVALLLLILLMNIAFKWRLVNPSSASTLFLIVAFLYFSIVITHPLIPIFIISFAFAYYILSYVRKNRTRDITQPLFFTVIYAAWIVFQAFGFAKSNILDVVQSLRDLTGIFSRAALGRGFFGVSTSYTIVYWTRMGLMAAMLGLALIGLVKIFVQQRKKTVRNQDSRTIITTFVLAYVCGAVPLLMFSYGGEIFVRVFYILLPFLGCLAALTVGGNKKAAALLISILLLIMPIASIGDESITFVSNNEISGVSFFESHFDVKTRYLYEFPGLIFYFDTYGPPHFTEYSRVAKLRFNQTYALSLINASSWDYFLDTQSTRKYYLWYLGFDLGDKIVSAYTNSTPLNRIYDSGDFQIFGKP